MTSELFYKLFSGNETNFDWLKSKEIDKTTLKSLENCKDEIYYSQKSLLENQEAMQITIGELKDLIKNLDKVIERLKMQRVK